MGRIAKNLGATLVALGLVVGATTKANASLVLMSGTGGTISTNNFGFSGYYYDGEGLSNGNQVYRSHPGGGPVALLVVVNSDLSFSLYSDAKAGPYDGSEDSQVGVLNNSSTSLSSITLKGPNSTFGFDGDGINTFGAPGNGKDSTGYGGPQSYFTNITPNQSTGTVNFIGGLAAGASTYFSLELDPASLVGGGITPVSAVPEPSTMISAFVGALTTFGYAWRRRKAKA